MSTGAAKAPPEKTPLAANVEPAAAMLRKSRLDDVVMVRSPAFFAPVLRPTAEHEVIAILEQGPAGARPIKLPSPRSFHRMAA